MKNLVECLSIIPDKNLRQALTEAYSALVEAKVNSAMRDLYNFLLSTGDWAVDNGGKHDNKLKLRTPPEFQEYARTNFKQNETDSRSFSGAIPFSTTKNSNSRNLDNVVHQAAKAYNMACQCEYALKNHDLSAMEWPQKAKAFEDRFCSGNPVWKPDEQDMSTTVADTPEKPYPEKSYVVNSDGQSYEETWKAYADKNRKMRKH